MQNEYAPPSYEETVGRDPWPVIAPYLSRLELLSLGRTCKSIHHVVMPHIWGSVMQHFIPGREDPYQVLAYFERYYRCLMAGQGHPELVSTLYVSPASEIHRQFGRLAISSMLKHTDNLQALIVSGLSSFDHGLLTSINDLKVENLRLLIARECSNATSSGLAHLLSTLHALEHLDLSYTKAASAFSVAEAINQNCGSLRVLKLRRVGLSMQSLNSIVYRAFTRPHLRHLDVRDNGIMIQGFNKDIKIPREANRPRPTSNEDRDFEMNLLRNIFLHDRAWYPAPFDGDDEKLTHWQLSGNSIMPVSDGADLFGQINMRFADVSQLGTHNIESTVMRMAARNGDRLHFLRIDIDSFPLYYDSSQIKSNPNEQDSLPEYDKLFGSTSSKDASKSSLLEHFTALETLVLTRVLAYEKTTDTIERIKSIIKMHACLQFESQRSVRPSQLRKIVLEVAQPKAEQGGGVSSIGDRDTEALWDAAQGDFSFYSDEKPAVQHGDSPVSPSSSSPMSAKHPSEPVHDVVAELSRWRAERRDAWVRCKSHGLDLSDLAKEHWQGTVTIVRVSSDKTESVLRPAREAWDRWACLQDLNG